MSILDTFYILFKTNAKEESGAVDKLGKKLDETEKKVNDNDSSTKKLGLTFTDLTTSILASAAAVASFSKAKDLFFSGVDWAAQIQRVSQLTGQNAKEIAVWDSVVQDAGGNAGDFINFFTQTAKQFQEAGFGDHIKNIIPSLREFSNEIQNVDIQTALTMGHLRGIPDSIVLALKQGPEALQAMIDKENEANRVLDSSAQKAQNFNNELKEITRQGYQFGVSLIPVGEWLLKLLSEIGTVGNRVVGTVLNPIFNVMGWLASNVDLSGHANDAASAITGGARGVRNNNPGNLRRWAGAGSDGGFAVFATPEAGLHAESRQLELYGQRGIDTLSQIARTWAPAGDNNNVEAYIAALQKTTGFGRDQHLDLNDPFVRSMVARGINLHENGSDPYTAAQYAAAANGAISAADNTALNSAGNASGSKVLNVGTINVHTQATDADGVAQAIHGSLNDHFKSTIGNYDDGVAK